MISYHKFPTRQRRNVFKKATVKSKGKPAWNKHLLLYEKYSVFLHTCALYFNGYDNNRKTIKLKVSCKIFVSYSNQVNIAFDSESY